MSEIVMPAARSISSAAAAKRMPSRGARRRPMVDLPDPISPTSTIDRSRIDAAMAEDGLFGFRDMVRAAIPPVRRGTMVLRDMRRTAGIGCCACRADREKAARWRDYRSGHDD